NEIKVTDNVLPAAKLGRGNRFFIWSNWGAAPHHFAIAAVPMLNFHNGNYPGATRQITPQEAFELDSKIDDGIPTTGGVKSMANPAVVPALGNGHASPVVGTHCYDSDNPPSYSRSTEAHTNTPSCALILPADF